MLITEGLWHSKTSDQIAGLLEQGLSVAEIAQQLVVSEKNVQSYMPYSRGQYGGDDRSNEAIRSEEYCERMQNAAKKQVKNTEAKPQKQQDNIEEQQRLMEERKAEKELFEDAFGREVTGEELKKIRNVRRKMKPVCIAWDGMNLVDDVGGIGGFCAFLETINGNDPEEKRENMIWAKSLGWTGRMAKPENIL